MTRAFLIPEAAARDVYRVEAPAGRWWAREGNTAVLVGGRGLPWGASRRDAEAGNLGDTAFKREAEGKRGLAGHVHRSPTTEH